ncbi:MAG TPA: hypothetical protein VJ792_02415 [Candidatus Nitrosotalea sp.]|nr:hypothetical protein [Candidatus Nitrosotalea sp.]
MPLTDDEKLAVLISKAMTLYSAYLEEGKVPRNQSIVDFILKSMPEQFKSKLSMDKIDDIFAFISSNSMELS